MIAFLHLCRVMFHILLAEKAPAFAADAIAAMAVKLLRLGEQRNHFQSKHKARVGKPFLGKAMCHTISCLHNFTVFCREGCHPDIELECPKCGEQTAALV